MLANAEANYDRHSQVARALAEEFFDSRKVIKEVLERVLVRGRVKALSISGDEMFGHPPHAR